MRQDGFERAYVGPCGENFRVELVNPNGSVELIKELGGVPVDALLGDRAFQIPAESVDAFLRADVPEIIMDTRVD